ncbi:MAG: putative hemolysin [Phreatobacter sp.]
MTAAGLGCGLAAPASAPATVGLANPASVHCSQLGGRLEIVTATGGGQVGMCHLPDGRICEEWALFRDKRCVPPGNRN